MNAYLLLAGIVTSIGLYTIWTRRSDEGGGFGLHLFVAAALVVFTASGKYLTTFGIAQQTGALVIGLVGLLLLRTINPFGTRRAPFGYAHSTTVILVALFSVTLLFSVQVELALYDGWPFFSTLLAAASLALFFMQRQALRVAIIPLVESPTRNTQNVPDEESSQR